MSSESLPAVFVDTSITIAALLHGPVQKGRIRLRLAQYGQVVSSLVVRQEFKRRILKEAAYLLTLLDRYGSYDEVNQHLIRLDGVWPKHRRKRIICQQVLAQVHPGDDASRTDRLRLYLRSLLVNGLRQFDQKLDRVRRESRCACAVAPVVEKVPLKKYDFGADKCSRTPAGACGLVEFLAVNKDVCDRLLNYLGGLPDPRKTAEIRAAEAFLQSVVRDPASARRQDPCLCVGDLLIALESIQERHFYTLNGRESQHFARVLGQTLVVLPIDPLRPEVVCPADSPEWLSFGPG